MTAIRSTGAAAGRRSTDTGLDVVTGAFSYSGASMARALPAGRAGGCAP